MPIPNQSDMVGKEPVERTYSRPKPANRRPTSSGQYRDGAQNLESLMQTNLDITPSTLGGRDSHASSALPPDHAWDAWYSGSASNINPEQGLLSLTSDLAGIDVSSLPEVRRSQTMKRKEQNKKSQRAYRHRKAEYVHSLQTEIDEMDKCISRLQTDNLMLIQHLCKLQAENNDIRHTSGGDVRTAADHGTREGTSDSGAQVISDAVPQPLSPDELRALYEPFLAMWNLLRSKLGPSQTDEDVASVLRRLHDMVIKQAIPATAPCTASPSSPKNL